MKRATLEAYLGRAFPILIEDSDHQGHWGGYTPNFLRVTLPETTESPLGNRIRDVQLETLDAGGETLRGRLF